MRTRTFTTGLAVLGVLAVPAAYAATTANADPAGTNIVISEVSTRDSASTDHNAIELHNPTGSAINLLTWSIVVEDSSGATTASHTFGNVAIPAGGFLVVKDSAYNLIASPGVTVEDFASCATDCMPQALGITLDNGSIVVDGFCTTSFSTACEGSPASQQTSATGDATNQRDHAVDTDDSAADFDLATTWGELKH